MDSQWIEKNTYWVTGAAQLEPFWYEARLCRVTGSRIGGLTGNSRFSTSSETAEEITGVNVREHSFSAKTLMQRGVTLEPHVRKWYSIRINKAISEMGLAVPKWDFRFGSSVDGIIDCETICEIKIPHKMYLPIINHRFKLSKGEKFNKYYHGHIWDNHYDQMQSSMAILGAKSCHYIIYLPSEQDNQIHQDVYCEVIPFNKKHWLSIYKKASEKYDELIIPIMEKNNLVRIDPN